MSKYFIWGLGSVGLSFLKKIIDNNLFDPDNFYCVEPNETKRSTFINFGGLKDHFFIDAIEKENVYFYLSKLDKGDFLFDFAIDIKNLDVLKYCNEHKIHYITTADSSWNPDPDWISDHQHFLEYSKLRDSSKRGNPTSIYLFGMNPGLVSCFVKKCIKEIVAHDNSNYVFIHRKKLQKLLNEKKYNLVCKKLKVTDIQEVDNDNQETFIPFEEDTCYSTWNTRGFYYETISSPEIAFGNKRRFLSYKDIEDADVNDLFLSLADCGFEYEEKTYSPQGNVFGHISTHEEVFTIRKYLTYKDYKPTVHFVYSPCEYAAKSVQLFKWEEPTNFHLLTKDEIHDGGESVGVIIQGKHFKTRYFGNYLDYKDTDEVPTILQVSASAFSAFKYILMHPNEGLLLPEDLDEEEMLRFAKDYLKDYISVQIPKVKMNLGKKKTV